MWDRIHPPRPLPPSVREPRRRLGEVGAILHQQAPGILAWIVQGAMDCSREGLGQEPSTVRIQTAEYRQSEDVIGQFLNENVHLRRERNYAERRYLSRIPWVG